MNKIEDFIFPNKPS